MSCKSSQAQHMRRVSASKWMDKENVVFLPVKDEMTSFSRKQMPLLSETSQILEDK